jgi:hypothetical protein
MFIAGQSQNIKTGHTSFETGGIQILGTVIHKNHIHK